MTSGEDRTARLWEVAAPFGFGSSDVNMAISRDGRRVVVGDAHGFLWLWTPGTGERKRLAHVPGGYVEAAALSPRGDMVAATGGYGSSIVVHVRDGEVRKLKRAGSYNVDVAFNADGTRLLTSSGEKVRLWDPYNQAKPLKTFDESYQEATFGDDGRILLQDFGTTPRVLDPASGGHIDRRGGEPAGSSQYGETLGRGDFSPDGHWVVTAEGSEAIVWDSRSGQVRSHLTGHRGDVTAAAYSSDGSHIATASEDGAVRVWDARSGRNVATLRPHAGPVADVAFMPSGQDLISAGADGTVAISPCYVCRSTPDLRKLARDSVTRPLTHDERVTYLAGSD
jgi:WD40 repeat protein